MTTPRPGFTLVELLVALVLFGLIAATATSAQRTAALLLGATERSARALDGIAAAQTVLRRQLETAVAATEPGERRVTFSGRADGAVWSGRRLAPTQPAGLYRTELRFERPRTGRPGQLVLLSRPEREGDATTVVLLEGVAELRLAYRGQQGGWVESWDDATALPALIRIALRLADFSAPDLIIAPGLVVLPKPSAERPVT